jgi:hypothetical protein
VNATEQNPARRLRLFLRDHRVLDANALVPHGQTLSTYLASRNRYVNLTAIEWVGTGETVGHMALKVDTILWAASQDGDLPLTGAIPSAASRRVDVELEGGYLIAAGLLLVDHQRLSDYLQSAPGFVPLRTAQLRPRGKELGDIAVNHQAIQVVREVEAGDAPDPDTLEDPSATQVTTAPPG